jgi:O-antigen ligase
MSRRGSLDRHALADLLAVAVTLAAPVFAAGGGVWASMLLLAFAAAALWLSPAVRRLPWWVDLAFLGFVLCGAWGLLPLASLADFPWSRDLTKLGVELPRTISAQPWLTLQGWLTLTATAAWAWFLLAREWRLPRHLLLQIFGLGAVLILLVWIAAAAAGRNLSGVTTQTAFGSFPNRNQSANFAALAGLAFAALALNGRLHRRRLWPFWLAALVVALVAVVWAGSRAGLLLIVVGVGAWFFWMGRTLRFSSPLLLVANGLLLTAGGLLAFGGSLLDRFDFARRTSEELASDFRLLLYRDALPLLGEASWHGIGLGNFAGVFARYRDASFNESRAIHPDSDWVWMIAEMGWLAPLCLGALLWFAFRQCRPFNEGSDRVLRSAGLVAGLAFLLHSLLDVPGHRATLWPGLLLLGLAANPILGSVSARPWLARSVAGVMTLAVIGQFALLTGGARVPGSEKVRSGKAALNRALDRGEWTNAVAHATRALCVAPLDWELYFGRASALVMVGADTQPAQRDFAVARYLEPNTRVAFDEGVAWLVRESDFVEANTFIGPRPELAAAAWRQVFTRPVRDTANVYGTMVFFAMRYPEIQPYLRELAGTDPARLAVFLERAPSAAVPEALNALLAASPDLEAVPTDRLRRVLGLWFEFGDRDRLLRELPTRPRWLLAGWIFLGDALVAQGELKRACELGRAHVPAPELPPSDVSLNFAREAYTTTPGDVSAAVRYFQKLSDEKQYDEALRVITALVKHPQAPAYVDWLEADLRERLGDLPGSWAAWRRGGSR